ncbi:sugar transferase [Leptolinea tardivitalis]|nr:sugar transferase [Leptolinea tardivitalis]GAP22656.1 sugar transferase [Leptolinea tardivitalis]
MSKKQPLPPEAIAAWLDKFPPEKRMFKGKTYLVLKRIMDLSIIFLSAPFWIPVLALVALAIKIDSPGAPVLFIQERTGKGGRRIKMYKFRTMVPNAEELKIKYADRNELQWPDFKITNDPRITRVGKFLRKTSLDETPQLFNIIKGEMSLVGPRPTSFSAKTYRLWQTERLDVTPGLTGLWQIFGRAAYEFDDRLRLDIAYIDRRSIWMDINILFETVWAVFSQRGAH